MNDFSASTRFTEKLSLVYRHLTYFCCIFRVDLWSVVMGFGSCVTEPESQTEMSPLIASILHFTTRNGGMRYGVTCNMVVMWPLKLQIIVFVFKQEIFCNIHYKQINFAVWIRSSIFTYLHNILLFRRKVKTTFHYKLYQTSRPFKLECKVYLSFAISSYVEGH